MLRNKVTKEEVEFKFFLSSVCCMELEDGVVYSLDLYWQDILEEMKERVYKARGGDSFRKIRETVLLITVAGLIQQKKYELINQYADVIKLAVSEEKLCLIDKNFNIADAYALSDLSGISVCTKDIHNKMLEVSKKKCASCGALKARGYMHLNNNDDDEVLNLVESICLHRYSAQRKNEHATDLKLKLVLEELYMAYTNKISSCG